MSKPDSLKVCNSLHLSP